MKRVLRIIKEKLFTKVEKEHSEAFNRRIAFLNKYSLFFHALISCGIVFIVEVLSRRDLISACSFVGSHTAAYFYNAFIVFSSLCLVYLFRRRAFLRIIISGFWILLGIINGCILSNRVTPFGFTDLKCINDLFAMTNTIGILLGTSIGGVLLDQVGAGGLLCFATVTAGGGMVLLFALLRGKETPSPDRI